MYGRDEEGPREGMRKELMNLNNRYVIVIPPIDILQKRLETRGDEFQDKDSLVRLWKIFIEESRALADYPNVLVITKPLHEAEMADVCLDFLEKFESMTPIEVGRMARDVVKATKNGEEVLELELQVDPNEDLSDVMLHPRESHYYKNIYQKCNKIIQDEMLGLNPYNLAQELTSRRFYYNDSTCISTIHFLLRDKQLKVLATLRSTDMDRNASIDLKFLCYLAGQINRSQRFGAKKIVLQTRFNSAHIRRDLPSWNKDETKE